MFSYLFMKWNGLNSVPMNLNQFFTEDMWIIFLFYLNPLNIFQNSVTILIRVIKICLFLLNKKKMANCAGNLSPQEGHFVTTVYRKPTFSDVYTHSESFLPKIYKFGMIYSLVYRCFEICSDWTKFQLNFLKQIFLKNGYPQSFIDNCFKTFLDKLFIKIPER